MPRRNKIEKGRESERDLRAARLDPLGVVEVIVGVVVAVVVQGSVLGLATVEIVVEGLDVVGVGHIILRLHRGNLTTREIQEPTIDRCTVVVECNNKGGKI